VIEQEGKVSCVLRLDVHREMELVFMQLLIGNISEMNISSE
jgi:hypothetical protein